MVFSILTFRDNQIDRIYIASKSMNVIACNCGYVCTVMFKLTNLFYTIIHITCSNWILDTTYERLKYVNNINLASNWNWRDGGEKVSDRKCVSKRVLIA